MCLNVAVRKICISVLFVNLFTLPELTPLEFCGNCHYDLCDLQPFLNIVPGCIMGGEKKKSEKARCVYPYSLLISAFVVSFAMYCRTVICSLYSFLVCFSSELFIVLHIPVCLSLRLHISKAICANFTKFSVCVVCGCGRSSSENNAIWYEFPVLWMSRFHIVAQMQVQVVGKLFTVTRQVNCIRPVKNCFRSSAN